MDKGVLEEEDDVKLREPLDGFSLRVSERRPIRIVDGVPGIA